MPAVVFTDPQVASGGLTEAAARAAGYAVRASTIGLDQVPRATPAGLSSLSPTSGRLLGAHTLAPEGADSIQTAALAIRYGLTVDDLADGLRLVEEDGARRPAIGKGEPVQLVEDAGMGRGRDPTTVSVRR